MHGTDERLCLKKVQGEKTSVKEGWREALGHIYNQSAWDLIDPPAEVTCIICEQTNVCKHTDTTEGVGAGGWGGNRQPRGCDKLTSINLLIISTNVKRTEPTPVQAEIINTSCVIIVT